MEIKAELQEPYTEIEKINFIVEQNHINGFEIKEVEKEIEETILDSETGEETHVTKTVKVIQALGYTEEEIEEQKQEQFAHDFFNTSLGYVRRKVNMKDGSVKDFLSDILPLLQADVPIITYNADGTQNTNVLVTNEFIDECKAQMLNDFYGN